jgi:hypothetical protein
MDVREGMKELTEALRNLFEEFKIKESVAFIELPIWYPLVEWLKDQYGTKILFDCLDEFNGFGNIRGDVDQLEGCFQNLRISVSRPLKDFTKENSSPL